MSNFTDMLANTNIIVSEVDGIITEGLSPLDNMNNALFKFYFTRDFEAINLLKKRFIFVFLSSDNNVSYNIMRTRNIPFFWAKKDKKDTLGEILRRYSVTPEQTIYVGCSYSDVDCVNIVPLSFCPNDAVSPVKRIINSRKEMYGFDGELNIFGGGGVLCMLYDFLHPYLSKILDKS